MSWLIIARIRQRTDSTIGTIALATLAPNAEDHLVELVKRRGLLLRLHLHDIQLLWGIEAEHRCLSLKDLHTQQSSLGVHILDRAGKERLQQRIEPLQVKRDVA